uniref:Uncharacterized protein n=1 Tax=Anguilla anguilla TaxID=7936 RepID=A0A0E9XTT2_ANGAN
MLSINYIAKHQKNVKENTPDKLEQKQLTFPLSV